MNHLHVHLTRRTKGTGTAWGARASILCTIILGCFGAANLQAAVAPCLSDTTVAALIALNAAGGCQSQDKIFSNFSYSGGDSASLIDASLIFQNPSATQQIHGWSFTNLNSSGEWLSNFTLGFTITVAPGNPNVTIIASKDQINSGLTGPGNGTAVTDTQSVAVLALNGLSTGNETVQVGYPAVTSVTSSTAATIPSGSLLLKYDQEFFENIATTTQTAEPATFMLLGGGLVCVALVGRRRKIRSGGASA